MRILRNFFLTVIFLVCNFFNAQQEDLVPNPKQKVVVSAKRPTFVILVGEGNAYEDKYIQREKKELLENFKDLRPQVLTEISDQIIFSNHNIKKFQFKKFEDPAIKVFFWDGKMDSDPIYYPALLLSSEFFGEKMDRNATSSYKTKFFELRDEYFSVKENITPKSAEISDVFLNKMTTAMIFFLERGNGNILDQNFKSVKSVHVKPNTIVDDLPQIKLNFNKEGQPIKFSYQGQGKMQDFPIRYENGILKSWGGSEIVYDDDKLILFEDKESRTVYRHDGKFLLSRSDFFYDDEYSIGWREISLEKNILKYREDGDLNNATYTLNSLKNLYPISYTAAFSEGEKTIERRDNQIIMNLAAPKKITYFLNSRGLVERQLIESNKTIEIQYLYEYY